MYTLAILDVEALVNIDEVTKFHVQVVADHFVLPSLHHRGSGQSEWCYAIFYHCNNIGQINSEVEKKVAIIPNNDGVSGNSWRISIVAALRVATNPQSHQKGGIQHFEATPDSPE